MRTFGATVTVIRCVLFFTRVSSLMNWGAYEPSLTDCLAQAQALVMRDESGSGLDRHRGVGLQTPLVEGCTGDVVVGSLLAVQEDAEEDVVGGIRLLDEGGGVRGAAAVSSTTNVAQQAEIRAGDFIARTGERPEAQK